VSQNMKAMIRILLFLLCAAYVFSSSVHAGQQKKKNGTTAIDIKDFEDNRHHWYDIRDEARVIDPLPDQRRYPPSDVAKIADNILLYQKSNGGWPKNYDMLAVLTDGQKSNLQKVFNERNTTFDNGATYSHVEYLARAYTQTNDARYRDASLRGIDFILWAQYPNGGWPQFFPDTSGYRKYITFNDGAMPGIMKVLYGILKNSDEYSFVDDARRVKIQDAFRRGVACILRCQIVQNGRLTVWCQQHDQRDYRPQKARSFEPASLCSSESAELVIFLMSLENPDTSIVRSVQSAVQWFRDSEIHGIRVETVSAPTVVYQYHTTDIDKVVVNDPNATPIWARMYELGTNRPLFCNRSEQVVYSLAEVDRERRTGYAWYTYDPEGMLKKYETWSKNLQQKKK
jgi:PelA/Pel-15E family pectate lyase